MSGLKFNQDFFAGYSPERMNPGDKAHRVTTIKKVTSGSTPKAADFVDGLYREIVSAGTHKAPSIRVAEAAKVIEFLKVEVPGKLNRCAEQLNSLLPEENITLADGPMSVGTKRRARKR